MNVYPLMNLQADTVPKKLTKWIFPVARGVIIVNVSRVSLVFVPYGAHAMRKEKSHVPGV
jgi:hypothetical protein